MRSQAMSYEQMSREELLVEIKQLQTANSQLAQQNMKLVFLNKERDQRLMRCEAVIRRYRSRLVRWFEDMQHDPLAFDIPEQEEVAMATYGVVSTTSIHNEQDALQAEEDGV